MSKPFTAKLYLATNPSQIPISLDCFFMLLNSFFQFESLKDSFLFINANNSACRTRLDFLPRNWGFLSPVEICLEISLGVNFSFGLWVFLVSNYTTFTKDVRDNRDCTRNCDCRLFLKFFHKMFF